MAIGGVDIELWVDDEPFLRSAAQYLRWLYEAGLFSEPPALMLRLDAIIYRRVVRRGIAALMEQE